MRFGGRDGVGMDEMQWGVVGGFRAVGRVG
jgi:hypothetical protein